MRTHLIIASLLVLCIFGSCQKEYEDSIDPIPVTGAEFKSKVDGIQFTATLTSAIISDSIISLSGKTSDGQQIIFSVKDSGAHVYSLDINSITNVGAYVDASGSSFTSNQGSTPAESGGNLAIVSIDAVNRLMSGTFNFKVFRQQDSKQKIITEGVFRDISY